MGVFEDAAKKKEDALAEKKSASGVDTSWMDEAAKNSTRIDLQPVEKQSELRAAPTNGIPVIPVSTKRAPTMEEMAPRIAKDTRNMLKTVGEYAGVGSVALGGAALLGLAPPAAGIAAGGLSTISAGSYVSEGLMDALNGMKKQGAEKIALGLLEAAIPNRFAPGLKNLAYTVGVNAAQDALKEYADSTTDKELASELIELSANPTQLKTMMRLSNKPIEKP